MEEHATLPHLLQESDRFITCVELVTSRGTLADRGGKRVLDMARALAADPRFDALSITDNPGGNPMITADALGAPLKEGGQEVIIHLSCKDFNRNGLMGQAWKLANEGFDNILTLSGDYPIAGYQGQSGGVFDIDSIGLLKLLSDMNDGRFKDASPGRKPRPLKPTSFFLGAVVNNHKRLEAEVMPQYFKLAKKIRTGARFIISQIGYDARKQDELLKYMARHSLDVPVIANVFVLSGGVARFFHAGRIPGVEVTDDLLAVAQKQADSPDKGKAFFLEFAAQQCAIAKGLGYRGVYLGGHVGAEEYGRILDLADQFAADDWRDFARQIRFSRPGEFFYFEEDPDTGLAADQIDGEYLASKTPKGLRKARRKAPLAYKINRKVHDRVFESGKALFRLGAAISRKVEGGKLEKPLHTLEQACKIPGFDCRDCGDCSLPDIAYLCPESQCVKNQRNGPCGGTRQGTCEIGEKDCIWARAYERLKGYGEEETMLDGPVVIKDAGLEGTSAWANAFLKRDHHAKHDTDKNTSEKQEKPA